MKTCVKCKQEKNLKEFHNRKSAKDGKQGSCKVCNIGKVKKWQVDNPEKHIENWQRLSEKRDQMVLKARQYNIDVSDLRAIFEDAKGVCQICKKPPRRWLVIDHCHNSSSVRGVLCEMCNQGLGMFKGNIEALEGAIEYLQKDTKHRKFSKQARNFYKPLKEKPMFICENSRCDKEINRRSTFCQEHRKRSTKIEWPEVRVVLKLVEELGYCATGRKLNVSDNAVRKFIKRNTHATID